MPARKHGSSGSPYYHVWQAMLRRCDNPGNKRFYRYGGRGIEVCERWKNSFEAFAEDMGPKPAGLSIERIDNRKGYEPGNCRWGTPVEQARNTRRNRLVTLFGITAPLVAWAETFDMPYDTVKKRLNMGWSPERTFNAIDISIAWG